MVSDRLIVYDGVGIGYMTFRHGSWKAVFMTEQMHYETAGDTSQAYEAGIAWLMQRHCVQLEEHFGDIGLSEEFKQTLCGKRAE
jgi:hypothetical protein